jgi:(S)-ureidoglycine aminohydrolase
LNTITCQPGASLPSVEMHAAGCSQLVLSGGGVFRLGEDWHRVTAGDFIWVAPHCPQWFGALGKTPAKLLVYKN